MKNSAIWWTLGGLAAFVYGVFKLVSNVKPSNHSKEHMAAMTEKSIEARKKAKEDEKAEQ